MRLVVPISLSVALLASACNTSSTVDVGSGEVPDSLPASSHLPGDDPTTTTAPEDLPVDPVDYLLQAEDLPGWTYVPQMDFAAEPTFETPDCDSMQTAWGAHASAGSRIRASRADASFRQTVVEMPDEESAAAIIDAADDVWHECNPLVTTSGIQWWVEPIEAPELAGWKTTGLALGGSDDGLIWAITWFQQGTTIVFIDFDSENPWTEVKRVQQAIVARINGQPDPSLMEPTTSTTRPGQQDPTPNESTVPGTRPTITLPQDPVPLPLPVEPTPTTQRTDWKDHAAAGYVVESEFFGSGYERDYVFIETSSPSDPDDLIDGCDASPPPSMDGLSASYEHESNRAEVETIVGINNEQWAQATIDSMRQLGACDAQAVGVDSLRVINPTTNADDAVFLDIRASGLQMTLYLARFDDVMIGISYAAEDDSDLELPSIETLSNWARDIASLG